jgi:uncharacterized membrane protein
MYYTTTTTTAAPVWATTWAILPELPTATAEDISNEQQPRTATAWATICARFATLWAILKDYAAKTWDRIQNRTAKAARKVAKVAARAALFLFRFIWFAAILCASLGTLYALGSATADVLPHFWPLRLVAFFVMAAAAIGVELLLIMGTRRLDDATSNRLFNLH